MARKKKRKGVRGKARRRARKKVPLGVLIWTALILFILVVFLFNRVVIRDVMDRTELLTVLRRSVDNAAGRNHTAADAAHLPEVRRTGLPPATTSDDSGVSMPQPEARRDVAPSPVAATGPASGSEAAAASAAAPAPSDVAQPGVATTRTETRSATVPAPQDASPPQRAPSGREQRLFFAAVSAAGDIAMTGVMRSVDDTASPLTETLKTLFAGPDPSEIGQGLITLIPPAVTLNRVYVSERIAYVDVSENFRFNPLGREGLDAQLQQIVLSATEFPGVELVQILIDGRQVEFLGPEGIYIGEPIGRARFVGDPPATP